MVLKTFQGLLNMAFKFFCGERLLRQTKMPDPQGGPGSPEKTDGAQPWIVETLTTEKNCPMPCLLPGPYTNCGHCWFDCPAVSESKGVSLPKFLIHRKLSRTLPEAYAVLYSSRRCNIVLCDR